MIRKFHFLRNFLRLSLFTYITLVVMNSIQFIEVISQIGRIGKLVFCLFFIIITFFINQRARIKIGFRYGNLYVFLGALILFFSLLNISTNDNYLLVNIAFPLYFIFYFFYLKNFISLQSRIYRPNALLHEVKIEVLKLFRFSLLINFLIWSIMAGISNISLFNEDGNFSWFFQDEIHFGLYVASGFLISFYLRFNNYRKDKSLLNHIAIIGFFLIAMKSSRNAALIVGMSPLYLFVFTKLKTKLSFLFYLIPTMLLFFFPIFLRQVSFENLNKMSSGRWRIWSLALDKINDTNWLVGKGLFNLNDIVLIENQGLEFYYLDKVDHLSFHSSYVELLAAGGVSVILLFAYIIVKTWNKSKDIDRALLLAILSGALFESFLTQPFMIIAILFYMILFIENFKIIGLKRRNSITN